MVDKSKIVESYRQAELGRGHTKQNLGPYLVKDFINTSKLIKFIEDYQDGEAYLTKDGYKFLIEYYGLEELSQMLTNHNSDFPYGDDRTALEWFQHFNDAVEKSQ